MDTAAKQTTDLPYSKCLGNISKRKPTNAANEMTTPNNYRTRQKRILPKPKRTRKPAIINQYRFQRAVANPSCCAQNHRSRPNLAKRTEIAS